MGALSPARRLALEVGRQVRTRDAFASSLIDSLVDTSDLSPEDKAFATRLVLGVTSTWGTLDEVIDRSLDKRSDIKPKVRDALRISVYELLFLEKEAPVVVSQGVELVRSLAPKAAGLANAVLRKICTDTVGFPYGDPDQDDAALARSFGFPLWLCELLVQRFGKEGARTFMEQANGPAPLFLAPNQLLCSLEELKDSLDGEGVDVQVFQGNCLYCPSSSQGIASQTLARGLALVCDASAVANVELTPLPRGPFLEVGSGRGTKTLLLKGRFLESEDPDASVPYTALDNSEFKAKVLKERLAGLGVEGVSCVVGDARDLSDDACYDGAFLDVPCSGLGTLRRHPELRWKLTPADIQDLAQQSLEILSSVAQHIQPGGFLVYSTCTLTLEEDEGLVAAFLEQQGEWQLERERPVPIPSQQVGPVPDIHYAALLRRRP